MHATYTKQYDLDAYLKKLGIEKQYATDAYLRVTPTETKTFIKEYSS